MGLEMISLDQKLDVWRKRQKAFVWPGKTGQDPSKWGSD